MVVTSKNHGSVSAGACPTTGRHGHGRQFAGFTLVELLVVIIIIAVLGGLALPAVSAARESARRASCSANQTRLVLGASRFHSSRGFLPGTLNMPKSGTRKISWFGMLLPYVGRNDLFTQLNKGTVGADMAASIVSEGLCPSGMPRMQYVAGNKGSSDWVFTFLGYGVNAGTSHDPQFRAYDGALVPNDAGHRKTYDDISARDGLANTWFTADSTGHMIIRDFQVGIQASDRDWHFWSDPSSNKAGLVRFLSDTPPSPVLNNWGPPGGQPPALNSAPPRSKHPGGVVFTFCDGRSKFIKEDLSARVYAHLSTSHSVWAGSGYDSARNSARVRGWLVHNPTGEPVSEPLRLTDGVDY